MSDSLDPNGLVFVLVGPSGVGKNTLMGDALARFSDLHQLPTATTRAIREGEQEGREHFFVSREGFQDLIGNDRLLEHQDVHGECYGIIRETIETAINNRQDLIADIEVLGAAILQREYPDNAVLIFIAPPTRHALEARIRERGNVSEAELARRLQRVDFEMQYTSTSDYLIVNDDLDQAASHLIAIISAERCRRDQRQTSVSVLIASQDRVLISAPSSPEAPELPRTRVRPGESPKAAALRLAEEVGVGEVSLLCHSSLAADDCPPVDFEVHEHNGQRQFDLVYACEVLPDSIPVKTGWRWITIEAVPLAKGVYQARPRWLST